MNIDIENYKRIKKGEKILFRKYKIYIKKIGCNAKCPMCNDWKEIGDNKNIIKSLYMVIKNIIKDPVEKKHIEILGGELLIIFKDLYKIIYLCNKYNIEIEFPTNGTLLNYKKINLLINVGLKSFTFSIDYPSKTHNKWRKLEGAYEKIINYSKYLKNKGIIVKWNTVIGNYNYKFINDFWIIYNIVKPDIHNYIYLENINDFSKKNLIYTKNIQKSIIKLKNNFKGIILNLPDLKINSENKEMIFNKNISNKKINRCLIPLINKVYFIEKDGNILISPCSISYTNTTTLLNTEEEYNNFIKLKINKNCSKCSLKYKSHFNYVINKKLLKM